MEQTENEKSAIPRRRFVKVALVASGASLAYQRPIIAAASASSSLSPGPGKILNFSWTTTTCPTVEGSIQTACGTGDYDYQGSFKYQFPAGIVLGASIVISDLDVTGQAAGTQKQGLIGIVGAGPYTATLIDEGGGMEFRAAGMGVTYHDDLNPVMSAVCELGALVNPEAPIDFYGFPDLGGPIDDIAMTCLANGACDVNSGPISALMSHACW